MAARAAALEPLAAVVEVGRAVAGAAGAAGAQADFVPAAPALVDAVRLVLVVGQLGSDQPCTVQKREEKNFGRTKKIRSAQRRRMAISDTARALNHHGSRYQPRLTCIKLPLSRGIICSHMSRCHSVSHATSSNVSLTVESESRRN